MYVYQSLLIYEFAYSLKFIWIPNSVLEAFLHVYRYKAKKKKKKLPNMNFSCPAEVEQNQVVTPCFSSHPVNTYSICPMFFADFTLYIGLQAKN